jgi:hypothetical protein
MIAKKHGKYRVALFCGPSDLLTDDAVCLIHIDEFYDLFGSMATDHLKNLGKVELDTVIIEEAKP